MIKGLHHVGISVTDIEKTTAGLQGAIALETATRFKVTDGQMAREVLGLTGAAADAVILRGPNLFLELFHYTSPDPGPLREKPVEEAGITHICLQSADLKTLQTGLTAGGARFPDGGVALGTGYLYAYGRDRDLNLMETEGAPFAATVPGSWFGHVAFATPDITRLAKFYADLTAWAVTPARRLRRNKLFDDVTGLKDVDVTAAWVQGPNCTLEFWQYHNPPTLPPAGQRPVNLLGYNHICFEVEDIASAHARGLELGATLQGGIFQTPLAGLAYLRDPDGNVFELVQWHEKGQGLSLATLPRPHVLADVRAAKENAG